MEREELRPLEPRRPDAGYDSQGQLIQDLSAWVDLLLYQYYAHHQWLGPDSSLKNMLGLVVSREEFEHNLTRAAQRGLWTQQTAEEQEDAMAVLEAIGARIEKTWAELPLLELMDRFDLDDFAFCCVVLAYLPHVDRKYERLYAYLQDDMTRKCPDTALAVQLFLPWGETPEGYLARFAGQGGFLRLFKPDKLAQGSLDLQDVAVEYLSAGSIASRPGLRLFDGTKESPEAPLAIQQETARRLDRAMAGQEPCTVLLTGPAGVGKKFQVAHLMARKGLRCVFADLEGEEWAQRAEEAALAADLTGACLCLYHLDRQEGAESRPPDGAMMDRLGRTEFLQGKRFFLSVERGPARLQGLTVELELPMPSEQERLELFRSASGRGGTGRGLHPGGAGGQIPVQPAADRGGLRPGGGAGRPGRGRPCAAEAAAPVLPPAGGPPAGRTGQPGAPGLQLGGRGPARGAKAADAAGLRPHTLPAPGLLWLGL